MHREELPIRFPCPDSRKPLSPSLHCVTCDRDVIELERLTATEVRALKKRAQSGERICVRYRTDEDGLIQLRPSPRRRLQAALAAAAVATLVVGGTAAGDASVPRARSQASVPVTHTNASRNTNTHTNGNSNTSAKTDKAPTPPAAPKKHDYELYDGGI